MRINKDKQGVHERVDEAAKKGLSWNLYKVWKAVTEHLQGA